MKYDLPCAIVQDLLPNYLEGLTSEEQTVPSRHIWPPVQTVPHTNPPWQEKILPQKRRNR